MVKDGSAAPAKKADKGLRDQPGRPARRTTIPPEIIKLLGTMSDDVLARQCGRPRSSIRYARISRGIELVKENVQLPAEIIQALGTVQDCVLARQAGRPESTIRSARARRGIPTYQPRYECSDNHAVSGSDFTDETRKPSPARHRNHLTRSKLRYEPPPGMLEDLGKMQDTVVAKKHNVTIKWVRKVRMVYSIAKHAPLAELSEKIRPFLGKVSDRSIAKKFGCSAFYCKSLRGSLGIPSYEARGRNSGRLEIPMTVPCKSLRDLPPAAIPDTHIAT